MRGEVVHYDEVQGFGFLQGADGNSYSFRREDLRRAVPMPKGTTVEFEGHGGQARAIFTLGLAAEMAPQTQPWQPTASAPRHFGRDAVAGDAETTGLWSFFRRSLTANYANFRGRARRKEYWGYFLFWFIALVVISSAAVALDFAIGNFEPGNEKPIATIGLPVIFLLATLIPGIALTVRRIHDIGLSGWFYLLVFVPSVGSLIILVFALIPSQTRDNKWGPVPQGIRIPPPYTPT